ncbi:MAG TPA: hypothetical protein VJY37_01390 [Anaerovoracaceae bacterium]|nr:hypothetical protein [Anaerovoracaceae bacterium]
MLRKYLLNLRKFDGEGAIAGTGEGNPSDAEGEQGEQQVVYGKVEKEQPEKDPDATDTTDPEARNTEFERLIQGDYKDIYEKKFQEVFNKRFKDYKTLQKQTEDAKPLIDLLGPKYGVSDGDLSKLAKAIEQDSSMWEEAAFEQGLTVEQYKHMKQLEKESQAFREMQQQAEQERGAEETYNRWLQQSEQLRTLYPTFELEAEIRNPATGQKFMDVLAATNDVKVAFQAIHFDEILPSAMQVTAQKVKEATVSNIKSRNQRPRENGINSSNAVVIKNDPSKWSDADIDEVIRRVEAGEKIRL